MLITDIRCEACGRNSDEATSSISINFEKNGEQSIMCDSCRRWVRDGVLRKERDADGNEVYRVWRFNIGPWEPTDAVTPVVRQKES